MSPTNASPANVLVVDDDQLIRHVVAALLRKMGHTGVLVNDGQSALDCLASRRFDLVLMDVSMPVLDGMATLACLRRLDSAHRRQRVVMMTAHTETGDGARLHAAGADGYIAKPIDPLQFASEIARVLAE